MATPLPMGMSTSTFRRDLEEMGVIDGPLSFYYNKIKYIHILHYMLTNGDGHLNLRRDGGPPP